MTDWNTSWDDFVAQAANDRRSRAPATLGEVWSSEFARSGLDTVSGIGKPLREATDDLERAIETQSGKPIADYAAEKRVPIGGAVTVDEYARRLGVLADTLPDEAARETIKPLRDVRLNASKKAQAIERDAADTAAATYGLSGVATAFVAGVARQTIDPVNLAAMGVTAPLGGGAGLLRLVGREALINAATQAAVEPYVEPERARLGLEAGFGRAAQNVIEAGIGGGVFAGLLHGAGAVLRYATGGRAAEAMGSPLSEAPLVRPAERAAGDLAPADAAIVAAGRSADRAAEDVVYLPEHLSQVGPDDMAAAARLAERDHVIASLSDAKEADGVVAHTAAVDNAARAMEGGRPVSFEEPRPPLVVARQMADGTVRYGEPGQIHADLIDAAELRADPYFPPSVDDMGFAEQSGAPFMSRDAATKWLDVNRPDVSARIDGIRDSSGARQIEAGQLNRAAGEQSARAEYKLSDRPSQPNAGNPNLLRYEIAGPDGADAGAVLVSIYGTTAKIENIETPSGSNALGARAIRSLLREFRERHPEVRELTGERISGARFGGEEVYEGRYVDMRLPETMKAPPPKEAPPAPKVESAGDAAAAARASALQAETLRAIEDAGDFDVVLQNADGSTRTVKASEALREVADDVSAQAELEKCIAGGTAEAAE